MRFHQLEEALRDHGGPGSVPLRLLRMAHKFYAGEIDAVASMTGTPDVCPRLPYPCCAVEFMLPNGMPVIALCAQDAENRLAIGVHAGYDTKEVKWALVCRLEATVGLPLTAPGNKSYIASWIPPQRAEFMMKEFAPVGDVVTRFFAVLNCVNVQQRSIPPSEKLNRKRRARKKPPIYEYKVLVLRRGTAATQALGGTHEPPRVHLRRGHIKRRKTGNFWWQPHAVGDPTRGCVMKEYRADKLIAAAPLISELLA